MERAFHERAVPLQFFRLSGFLLRLKVFSLVQMAAVVGEKPWVSSGTFSLCTPYISCQNYLPMADHTLVSGSTIEKHATEALGQTVVVRLSGVRLSSGKVVLEEALLWQTN